MKICLPAITSILSLQLFSQLKLISSEDSVENIFPSLEGLFDSQPPSYDESVKNNKNGRLYPSLDDLASFQPPSYDESVKNNKNGRLYPSLDDLASFQPPSYDEPIQNDNMKKKQQRKKQSKKIEDESSDQNMNAKLFKIIGNGLIYEKTMVDLKKARRAVAQNQPILKLEEFSKISKIYDSHLSRIAPSIENAFYDKNKLKTLISNCLFYGKREYASPTSKNDFIAPLLRCSESLSYILNKESNDIEDKIEEVMSIFKNIRMINSIENLPLAEICISFIQHFDYLDTTGAFSPVRSSEMGDYVKSVYISLMNLCNNLNEIKMEGTKKLTDKNTWNFIKNDFSENLRSFNTNTLVLFSRINQNTIDRVTQRKMIYRTLSTHRVINSFFNLVRDILIHSEKKDVELMERNLSFLLSSLILYSVSEKNLDKLTVENIVGSVRILPVRRWWHMFWSPKDDLISYSETSKDLRRVKSIINWIETNTSELNRRMNQKKKQDEREKLDQILKKEHPEIFERSQKKLDSLLNLAYLVTKVNLSSLRTEGNIDKEIINKKINEAFKSPCISEMKAAEMKIDPERLNEIKNNTFQSAKRLEILQLVHQIEFKMTLGLICISFVLFLIK